MSGPPSMPGPPPGLNLHDDQGGKVLGTMIALIALASTFVILRLTSRHLARAGFWWDDVLIIVALLLAIAPCICSIVAVKHVGFGKHIYVFGKAGAMEAATGYFHTLYFFQLFFTLATGATKLTILAFYRRIFPIAELRLILIVMTTVVVMYTTAVSTLIIFQCRPIRKFWEFELPGYCINPKNNLAVSGSVNTLLDFMIVCLPVPLLWRLRTSTRQKSILTGIFLTAGFVCIVSIVRIISFSRADPSDVTWNFVWVSIWSAVEPIAGILGACLPSLRPLLTLLLDNNAYRSFAATASQTFQSTTTTTSSSVLKSNQSSRKNRDPTTFARLKEEHDGNAPKTQRLPWRDPKGPRVYDHGMDGHNVTVYGGRGQQADGDGVEMERMSDVEPPRGVIRVKTEIFLSSSKRLDYNDRLY
ncbi:hypothetical protein HO133_006779 [Letharia lupina]|uniref:Rhodopsin domain-containing protein n=1 Tax=Letharia lupina TaxID=560253 RepID=A0A8H6C651_9LECA|nr:uncharacterized protein HO133_006779 [Letharia lupina]KAF6217677.1 hypothetical protein HO133_006779 [Letharia lupina]